MSTELLPCPFCGSKRIGWCSEHDADGLGVFWSIKCQECMASAGERLISNGNDCPQSRQEVRDAWNRRSQAPASQAPSSTPEGAVMTERDHFDFARWHLELGRLADEYYAAGSTSQARTRTRSALMFHALDAATGWRARSALAATPAAAPAPEVPSGWQPIETAPKNGRDVLVFTETGLVRLAFFDSARGGIWSSWPGRNEYAPTHWMPLPPAPRQGTNGTGSGEEPK